MNNKVFVGSLSYNTSNQGLSDYFAQCGTVTSANVIMNKEDGRSKGFGFVEFATEAEAQAAADKLNNTELDGRTIFVDIARPKEITTVVVTLVETVVDTVTTIVNIRKNT